MFKFGRDFWRPSGAIPLLKARPPTASCPVLSLAGSEYLKGCSSSPYFISFISLKTSWEKQAKALVKEIPCKQYLLPSPCLPSHLVHRCRHLSKAGQAWYLLVKSVLFLMTLSFMYQEMVPKKHCSITLLFFEDQSNISFSIVSSTSPSHQDHSKTIKSGLTVTQAIAISTRGYIPWGSIDLYMFSLLKYSLICSSSTKSTYSLLQAFPSSLGPGIPKGQRYQKTLMPRRHSVLQPFPCPLSCSAGLDSISVLLSGYLSLLPHSVCLSFVFEFPCLSMQPSCHFCLPSCSLGFATLEFWSSWSLNVNQISWAPLPSRALPHETLLSWS